MDAEREADWSGRRRSAAITLLAGLGATVAGSVLWGLAAYLLRHEFSVLAVLMGLGVGSVVARLRPGQRSAAAAAAISSAAGCAAGSLLAEILLAIGDHIPVTALAGHSGEIIRAYPATVGWLGFVFWMLAAVVGYAVVAWPDGWRIGSGPIRPWLPQAIPSHKK